MPGMFSRRRASSQPPAHTAPPSSSAAIAASTAFMQKSPSSTALSSAAAAAALRSHTTTPEPVGSLQTKRMARRGSQSSIASGSVMGTPSRNGAGRAMSRRDSNSSMTERTFRSPSPGRPASRNSVAPASPNAPPVPAIPASLSKQPPRRSASVEPPMRVTSPTPTKGKRHSSVDYGNSIGSPRQSRKPDLPQLTELEREDSNRPNFSRPMSPGPPPARPQSTTGYFTSPVIGNGTPRGGPPSSRPQSTADYSSPSAQKVHQDVQAAADKPVKKKKKATSASEGANLANGTMNAAPYGTAVNSTQSPVAVPAATSQPAPVREKKKKTTVASPVDTEPSSPSSASSPRGQGTLHKQPSVVREDPEAEATAESSFTPSKKTHSKSHSMKEIGRIVNTTEGPAKAYVAPGGKARERAASLDIPRPASSQHRSGSVSPSRGMHARFAEGSKLATPLSVRHQPSLRSVSPMKSAMRQSPASSIRTSSPNISANGSRVAASDASDTTSMASQDGIKPLKQKKSVRISDGGTTVSPSTDPNARRELSGAWGSEDDETMKPRPALPSFGSVRGRKPPVAEIPEKVTETVSSSMTNSASTLPDRQETSNDYAIGAVLENHHAEKGRLSQPQELEVTTKEPLSESSDDEAADNVSNSTYSDAEAEPQAKRPVQATAKMLPSTLQSWAPVKESGSSLDSNVPDIAVQPATPGIEEENQHSLNAAAEDQFSDARLEQGDVDEVETESSEDEAAFAHADQIPPVLQPIYESDSDDSADFEDAEEDLSYLNNGGFASLDAMVKSPPAPTPVAVAIASPPDSPVAQLPAPKVPNSSSSAEENPDANWSQATAYWNSLSRTKKAEMEAEARAAELAAASTTGEAPKPRKKKPARMDITDPAAFAPSPTAPVASPGTPQSPSEQPDSRFPTMRKSMRQSAESQAPSNETHMRTSMRSSGSGSASGSMRSSMRGGDAQSKSAARKSALSSAPPVSASAIAAASRGAQLSKKSPQPVKPVAASIADDSDSDSSFRKKRRASVSTVDSMGKYAMKRSMRSGSVDGGRESRPTSPTPKKQSAGRLSLRSLSPTGSFMGRNRENIRASLRGPPVDNTPTMRGKNSKAARDAKSPTRFSMSGFSKPKSEPDPVPRSSRSSGFRSRFADSDDEDDAVPSSGFRSRFDDSDEEDSPVAPPKKMPSDLAPVRGIPKRRDLNEDSTDLDDSDEEPRRGKKGAGRVSKKPMVPSQSDIDAAMAAARRNVAAMNGGREPGLPPARLERTSTEQSANVISQPATPTRRKGFMGGLLRRGSSFSMAPASPTIPQSPASRPPKLQRRNTPQNWPLPATPATATTNGDDVRPVTSDGTSIPSMRKSMRPDLGRRSFSGSDLRGMAASGNESAKKKKFSRLRKVFGLHD